MSWPKFDREAAHALTTPGWYTAGPGTDELVTSLKEAMALLEFTENRIQEFLQHPHTDKNAADLLVPPEPGPEPVLEVCLSCGRADCYGM